MKQSPRKTEALRATRWQRVLGCLALCLAVAITTACFGQTLRLTTWNLEAPNAGATTNRDWLLQQAATLKELNPDLIALQHVRDWQTCAQLAEALGPGEYNVVLCSAFHDASIGASEAGQVAFLSREKAYFSWAELWQPPGGNPLRPGTGASRRPSGGGKLPGGFAFVAMQAGKVRVGVLSVEFDSGLSAEAAVSQLLAQVDSIRHWEANRVQSFVIAATFDAPVGSGADAREETLRRLLDAGFVDTDLGKASNPRTTLTPNRDQPGMAADYILSESTAFPLDFRSAPAAAHYPVTCSLELDPAKVAASFATRADELERRSRALAREAAANPGGLGGVVGSRLPWWLAAGSGALAASVAFLWFFARRPQLRVGPSALIPETFDNPQAVSSSYTVVMAPLSSTSSAAEHAAPLAAPHPVIHLENPGATQTQSAWQQRALAAEEKAERTQALVRKGMIPHLQRWLKQKVLRRLVADRSELLNAQQAATHKARAVDERLTRIELQIKQQNLAYERRLEELTLELLAAKEENRELIRARIVQVKAEMEAARARALAQANAPAEPSQGEP